MWELGIFELCKLSYHEYWARKDFKSALLVGASKEKKILKNLKSQCIYWTFYKINICETSWPSLQFRLRKIKVAHSRTFKMLNFLGGMYHHYFFSSSRILFLIYHVFIFVLSDAMDNKVTLKMQGKYRVNIFNSINNFLGNDIQYGAFCISE